MESRTGAEHDEWRWQRSDTGLPFHQMSSRRDTSTSKSSVRTPPRNAIYLNKSRDKGVFLFGFKRKSMEINRKSIEINRVLLDLGPDLA